MLGDTPWKPQLQMVIPSQPHIVQRVSRWVGDSSTFSEKRKKEKNSFLGSLFGSIMGGSSSSQGNSR